VALIIYVPENGHTAKLTSSDSSTVQCSNVQKVFSIGINDRSKLYYNIYNIYIIYIII